MSLLDSELILYAGSFAVGLLLGVYAMLHGSVRSGREPGSVIPPPAGFNLPVVAAALTAFGAVGYPVAKYSQAGALGTILVALLTAAAGWTAMTILMARWALRGPLHDPHEELEELQGTVATVTREITPELPGEIVYSFRGARRTARARAPGAETVPPGTEVVIERIDDGVADVELWAVVEQRI